MLEDDQGGRESKGHVGSKPPFGRGALAMEDHFGASGADGGNHLLPLDA
jgi:hypothetical protein